MFTGIIEEVGAVRSASGGKLRIAAAKVLEGTDPGDSIAVNGACLTAIEIDRDGFTVEVMPETLRRTSLGKLRPGAKVNLERALAVGGRLGGHFVQGHVDGTGKIQSLTPEGDAILMRVSAPPQIIRYAVEKGFIAVDGVSLTVFDCDTSSFSVSLVTFTREHTTLGERKPGEDVNLEIDIMAKYVERLAGPPQGKINTDFLTEHGFV